MQTNQTQDNNHPAGLGGGLFGALTTYTPGATIANNSLRDAVSGMLEFMQLYSQMLIKQNEASSVDAEFAAESAKEQGEAQEMSGIMQAVGTGIDSLRNFAQAGTQIGGSMFQSSQTSDLANQIENVKSYQSEVDNALESSPADTQASTNAEKTTLEEDDYQKLKERAISGTNNISDHPEDKDALNVAEESDLKALQESVSEQLNDLQSQLDNLSKSLPQKVQLIQTITNAVGLAGKAVTQGFAGKYSNDAMQASSRETIAKNALQMLTGLISGNAQKQAEMLQQAEQMIQNEETVTQSTVYRG